MMANLKPVVLEGSDVKIYHDKGFLTIEAPQGKPARVQLLKIISPLISQPNYAISGSFSYSDVGGEGYLEMWSDFGNLGRFFSRTLATSGPMAHLVGESGVAPRDFQLPFDTMEKTPAPQSLEINLILPQGGKVGFLMNMVTLREFPPFPTQVSATTHPSNKPLIYGMSILGGILGLASGLLAFRFPRRASALAWIGLSLGVSLLVLGLAAPWFSPLVNASYSLLAGGVLVTILFTGLLWYASRLRQKHELRRMAAMDLG